MDIYQSLAQIVLSQCPAGYTRAVLEAEVDDGWAEMTVRCSKEGAEEKIPDMDGAAMEKITVDLINIRDDMAETHGQKWKRCIFYINDDKTFRINVQY